MSQAEPAATGADTPRRNLLAQLEIDTRLLGMIGAFIVVCLVFNVLTDGRFLTPRNIFNLTIQTVSVAIMATGMVFVMVCVAALFFFLIDQVLSTVIKLILALCLQPAQPLWR